MKNARKWFALLLTLAMVLSFTACAKAEPEAAPAETPAEAPAEAPAENAEKVTIEMWVTENDLENMQSPWFKEMVDAFNAQSETAEVKLVCIGQDPATYSAKWDLAASTNELPDILPVTMDRLPQWIEAGVIVDLAADFGTDAALMDRFTPGAVEALNKFCPEGAICGLPYKAETFGWIYNQELFDQCNLEIPTTWDELLNCVKVFNEAGITPIVQAGTDAWAIWGYHPFFTKYGFTYEMAQQIMAGELKYADCEPIVKAFNRMDELAKAGAFNEDAYAISHGEAMARFEAGQAAIYTTYSAIGGEIQNTEMKNRTRYDAVGPEFPDGALDGPSGLRIFSWNLCVGAVAQSDPARYAAVQEFLKFFFSEDGTAIQVAAGQPIATKFDYSGVELTVMEQDIQNSFSADFISCDYAFNSWFTSEYKTGFTALMTGVLTQTGTVEEALATLQQNADNANASK